MTDHSRKVLRVQGDDPRGFLQGLVTNDVALLDRGMVYSALLTPQGKLIADFFLVPSGNDILIDVHANWADAVLSRLTMYKLRTKIELTLTEIPVTRGVNAQPDSAFADPRHPSLGWRDYTGAPEEQGIDWDALHVAATVPQSCVELTPDTFILEAGFERLNGVDFRKGCYVGQEVTARMKHKTELRKGFATVDIEGTAAPNTPIECDGKVVGTLFTQSGSRALAYLRFDRAGLNMSAGTARVSWSDSPEI